MSGTYLERVMNSVLGMMYLVFEGMLACMQKLKRCCMLIDCFNSISTFGLFQASDCRLQGYIGKVS